MFKRATITAVITGLACSSGFAQSADETYVVPRTEYDQPDLQGVWSTQFNTMLERPLGLPLVLPREAAAGFAQALRAGAPDNIDPDIDSFGPPKLAVVKGEYRTSMIVYPENGRLPFNELGAQTANYPYFKDDMDFDHPEQRPGVERCLESWGFPPMRAFLYQSFHGIVQTADKIAIVSEDNLPLRVIHLNGQDWPAAIRTLQGHSVGHWEGDSLVVETTLFDGDNPARVTIERPVLLSGDARVTERFTRVAENELFYQYTVDDPVYYTEPWRGEFSFTREAGGHIYEYSCHEGNYSMIGGLRGARFEEAQEAKTAGN